MRISTQEIASSLCCPDDRGPLCSVNGAFQCSQCGRIYPIREGEIIELLPEKPVEPWSNPEYAAEYGQLFHKSFENGKEAIPWGLHEPSPPSWKLHRDRQARAVLSLLERDRAPLQDLTLCDVSAGVGDYTLSYARHFKRVLHCDLSVDALRYASAKCRRMDVENVFFLRVDYFALPFTRSIDRLVCLDTLIRGEDHEKALLGQIQKALSSQGRAVIDFHHWWHNPLRRLGLLRQNFGNNRSYARGGAEGLMRECGIDNWRLDRFHQEFEPTSPFAQGLSRLLPATRLVYEIASALSGPTPSDSVEPRPPANSPFSPSDSPPRATRRPDAPV
jgi:SAM-dependent methyltransferase/uncharacterized protein YbaR (Trm112 family)